MKRWSDMPAPSLWKTNSVWSLQVIDRKNRQVGHLTIKLTDQLAKIPDYDPHTLLAQVVSTDIPELVEICGSASYTMKGAALSIDLSTGCYDDYRFIAGHLSEEGFSGEFTRWGMLGQVSIGRVVGLLSK